MQSVVSKAETVVISNVGQVRSKDTACGTPAECELRELAVNKCNYGRLALQNTYKSLNVVAHVLGSLVSTLCGCVHVEHVSHCILQNVPPMCTFLYTVYSKVFAGSVQVWEAVKASTKSCMLHRGPAIKREVAATCDFRSPMRPRICCSEGMPRAPSMYAVHAHFVRAPIAHLR